MRPGTVLFPLYVAIVAVTSLRLPFAALAALSALMLARPPRTLLALPFLPAAAVVALAALGVALHSYTRHVAHPSTGPDAMIVPILRLLHCQQPYATRLWDAAPISPGPGWLLLNAPLTATGLIVLLTPAWLAITAALIARQAEGAATLFILSLCASRDFLVQSIVGHDIFAINLAVAALCLVIPSILAYPKRLLPLAVLAGLIVTARVPLLPLIPIIGLGLWRQNRRTAAVFTAAALLTALSTHAAFALWAAYDHLFYQPLHLFSRARNGAGPLFMLLSAVGAALSALAAHRLAAPTPARLMLCCWLFEFLTFAPIGLGELITVNHFRTAAWEGRLYIAWSLPLLCGTLALRAPQVERSKVLPG